MSIQTQSIRELDNEKSAAKAGDFMILQDFETGETYRIRRSDFLAGTQTSFLWNAATTYGLNAIVEWGGTFWRSLQSGNTNRLPAENSWWTEVEQADESAIKLFQANRIYKSDVVVVLQNDLLYRLANPARPYQAASFILSDWLLLAPRQDIAFATALRFDKDYVSVLNPQPGPVAFTLDATGAQPGRVHKVYIRSNGINKPTVSGAFVAQDDNYLNTLNRWNYLHFVYNASGQVDYWWTYQ